MIDDVPIVYSIQGEGEPLLILSSFPLRAASWQEFVTLLSPSFRVIVIEPPWLWEPHAMGNDYSSEHLLQVYRMFVRKLGIDKIHVLGVGEGGALAVAFGHHFPEHIKTAISINGFEGATWSVDTQKMLDLFYSSTEEGIEGLLKASSLKYQEKGPFSEDIRYLLEPLQKKERRRAVNARMTDLIQDIKSLYVTAMIEYINFPVLIIRSDNDTVLPEKYIDYARNRISKVEYQSIGKAGHFAFMDQPEKMAEVVRNFLLRYP
ncbi:MAG: alpha/beta hydrolase [Nitrospirota bacterium]